MKHHLGRFDPSAIVVAAIRTTHFPGPASSGTAAPKAVRLGATSGAGGGWPRLSRRAELPLHRIQLRRAVPGGTLPRTHNVPSGITVPKEAVLIAASHSTIHRRRAVAAVTCAGALLLSGCTKDEPARPAPAPTSVAPSAAPSATEDPAKAQARKDVVAVYETYQRVVMAASLKGDSRSKEFAEVIAEPLLGQTRNSIYQLTNAGLVVEGEKTWSVETVEVDLGGSTPTATIEDCTDISKTKLVIKKTGKPAPTPSGRPSKYLVTSQAKKVSGKWYISEAKSDWSRPC